MGTSAVATGLPEALVKKLHDFLVTAKTGNVVLDIKDGRILSWKLTEYGRVGDLPLTRD